MLITLRLRLHGDALDIGAVSERLKVDPHFACKKGSGDSALNPGVSFERTSRWEWYSEDLTKSLSVDDHISRMGITFDDVLSEFHGIPGVDHAWLDVSMIKMVKCGDTQASFMLNSASISIIARMGIPVEFTFYALTEDSDSLSQQK